MKVKVFFKRVGGINLNKEREWVRGTSEDEILQQSFRLSMMNGVFVIKKEEQKSCNPEPCMVPRPQRYVVLGQQDHIPRKESLG